MSEFAVILPAAGQSRRFQGQGQKKVFVALDGRPVWLRTADLFRDRADVRQVIVVISADDQQYFLDRFGSDLAVLGIDWVLGGSQRHDSVARGLEKIDPQARWVAIHDAARPCVTAREIDQVFQLAKQSGAAILAHPIHSTIKRIQPSESSSPPTVHQTIDRSQLWAAQTPQAFSRELLERAFRWLAEQPGGRLPEGQPLTDDSQLVELLGHTVRVVTGSPSNLKITTADDLRLAQAILKSRPKGANLFHPFAD